MEEIPNIVVDSNRFFVNIIHPINNKLLTTPRRIKDLPMYIVYNKNAADFYAKLGKVLNGLGLDNRNDTFENELVKLKIDYANVDVVNDKICIELMDKASGRVDKGMVSVDSLPTYYTNHKLFESLIRFKKLL